MTAEERDIWIETCKVMIAKYKKRDVERFGNILSCPMCQRSAQYKSDSYAPYRHCPACPISKGESGGCTYHTTWDDLKEITFSRNCNYPYKNGVRASEEDLAKACDARIRFYRNVIRNLKRRKVTQ